jgi:hypothetical protein
VRSPPAAVRVCSVATTTMKSVARSKTTPVLMTAEATGKRRGDGRLVRKRKKRRSKTHGESVSPSCAGDARNPAKHEGGTDVPLHLSWPIKRCGFSLPG